MLKIMRALGCALLAALVVFAALRLDFRQPFIGYGLGGAFLLFLGGRLGSIRNFAACLGGVVLAAAIIIGHYDSVPTLFVQAIGAFGLASLLVLACLVLWSGTEAEAAAYRVLLPAAVLTFLVLGAQYSLNMASLLRLRTFDLYAYVFDGSLGFQPSFLAGRILNEHPPLFSLVKFSYEAIVLAMAALYAGFMARREKPVWELIEVLFAAAMVGYLFFSVFPVCGPRYGFGPYFPGAYVPYEAIRRIAVESIPLSPMFPRNGVPSLHMTWALLIFLNTRGLPRAARTVALLLVLATVFDTLATGEHYLFDLIVALPFTLCMQASMVRTAKIQQRERWLPIVCGGAMFLMWLAIGRFALPLMLASRWLAWSLVLASSAVSLIWASRLPALIPEMQRPSPPALKSFTAIA